MLKSTHYYDSPIGSMEICTIGNEVTSCLFLEDMKTGTFAADNFGALVISQIDEYFKGTRKLFQLQMGDVGTLFDNLVWEEVCRIKYGHTSTYQELSDAIKAPDSVRAVGASNGRNPILLLVPCHRVISSDGTLRGYAGKVWRKKWLLEHESRIEWGITTLFEDAPKQDNGE